MRPLLLLLALAGCRADAPDGPGVPAQTGEATEGVTEPEGAYADFVARYGEDYDACGASRQSLPASCGDAETTTVDPSGLRVELVLDASGSMAAEAGGEPKMDAAREAIVDFAGRIPDAAQVALRVYGHVGTNEAADKARSCAGSELLQPFGPVDEGAFARAVGSFEPTGWTPIAASLEAAARDLAAVGGSEHVVYLVSDGIETCDGDPVAAARALHASGVRAVVNVIGFDVDADAARQLRAVAEAGGGTYLQADDREELWRAFNATSESAWARYNCVSEEQWGAYNETSEAQWGRYNCLNDKAWREYNATNDEAWQLFNMGEMDRETRASVVSQARDKRNTIVRAARAERNRVVRSSREQRNESVGSAREERNRRVGDAREARDEGFDD